MQSDRTNARLPGFQRVIPLAFRGRAVLFATSPHAAADLPAPPSTRGLAFAGAAHLPLQSPTMDSAVPPPPPVDRLARDVRKLSGLLVLLVVLLLPACHARPTSSLRDSAAVLAEHAPTDRSFAFAGGSMEFLDPARIAETAGHHLMMNVFEGLYVYNRGDGPPVPSMAQSREVTPDGLTWTFHLRPGVTWSDGKPLTAQDFVWSWRRVLDPKTASRAAQLLWFIAGAQAFNEGAVTDPETVAVHALDDHTLQVKLKNPTPFFDQLLCEMPYVVTPRHTVEQWGDHWTDPAHIVSNGPFLLADHQPRKISVLKKNPRYWDAGSVWLEKATIFHTESEQTAFDWYEVGKTQWHGDVSLPLDKVPALRDQGRVDFRTDPKLCSYYFSMRVDRPPFDDPRVRRAVAMAIDKERLALHVLKGGQPVATGGVPDLFVKTHGYHVLPGDPFDPEKARALLAEAGHPRGLGLPPIELYYNTGEGHRVIAEYVQRNLQENLGVRVQLANMEWGTLLKTLLSGQFSIGRSSWCADYPDPLTFLEVFQSDSKANYSGYKSKEYDGVLDAIKAEPDPQKRNGLLRRAEEILLRDLPLLPMYHYTWSYLVKPYVLGYEQHMQDQHPLKYIRYATPEELQRIRKGEAIHLPPIEIPMGVR
jgi:oligopeptide transport system substrate-binding protein